MTTTIETALSHPETTAWLEAHEAFLSALAGEAPAFVEALRARAIAHFSEIGFPTTRDEEWRFTNVAPVVRARYAAAPTGGEEVTLEQIGPFTYPDCTQLVFVNGRYTPAFSTVGDLPDGTVTAGLADAFTGHADLLEEHLGRYADFQGHAFAALNTAHLRDGALIYVPKGAILRDPIHLLYLTTEESSPQVLYPRTLLILDEDSQATVIESYAGLGRGKYLNCPVTEIAVGDYAVLEHYKIQQESLEASHMAMQKVRLGRSTTVTSQNIALGGGFVRNDVRALLDDEGGDCTLDGLYLTSGTQFVDNHMKVDHAKPNCRSFAMYKGILDGKSRAVFNGLIHVHKDAQKTDGIQTNRNLLLSREALVNTNPQLLIFADDVKCTHGSTVGEIDREALFYLRSRGIGLEAARSLLVYAFASEFVNKIQFEPVRKDLEESLFTRLPKGEIVRQAV